MGRRATIMDVARSAGVSPATVSRVLSGVKPVSAETTARVRDAVARLRYRPNPAAQSLLAGSAIRTAGVVVPDLANPYFAEVIKGLTGSAEAAGHRMLVADADQDPAAELQLVRELARWTSGVVLCSPRSTGPQLTELLDEVESIVLVNRDVPGTPSVRVDFAAGMRALLDHLVALGHRHLVYLQGPPSAWSEEQRRLALADARRTGLRIDELSCGTTSTDGYAAADAAFATGATTVLAFSDAVALGVLLRATELGVRIPEDVGLTGFDDIPLARITAPGLTTAAVDLPGLGRLAWQLLHLGTVPDGTAPQGSVPDATVAEDAGLPETVPGGTGPDTADPVGAVPDRAGPVEGSGHGDGSGAEPVPAAEVVVRPELVVRGSTGPARR